MKEYPKEYEDFFRPSDVWSPASLWTMKNINRDGGIEYGSIGEELFTEYYKRILLEFFDNVWLGAVRYSWLTFQFSRKGRPSWGDNLLKMRVTDRTAKKVDGSLRAEGIPFGTFPRRILGIDRWAMAESFAFRHTATYVPSLFPKEVLLAHDPFKEPEFFAFPYKKITLDFLLPVYQMEERLDLLKIAEDRGMVWEEFMDYVLNYISCYNEEHGKRFFSVVKRPPIPTYFRDARRVGLNRKVSTARKPVAPIFPPESEEGVQKL